MKDQKDNNSLISKSDCIPTLGSCFETEACRIQLVEACEFEVHFQAPRDVIGVPFHSTRCAIALDSDKAQSTELAASAANFHPAGSRTYSRTEVGKTTFLAIDFEPYVRENLEDELDQKARNESGLNLDNPNFQWILEDGLSFFRNGGTYGRLAIEALTLRLLVHTLDSSSTDRTQRRIQRLSGPRLKRFLDLIEMCLIDDVSLTELSDLIGLTPLEMLWAFYNATGTPLPEYVHERRLAHAMRILKDEDTSIANIASDVGFASADVLERAFLARLGTTPTQFRIQSLS